MFTGGGHIRPLTVVRSPRARAMRLAIQPRDGEVRLTLPRRASLPNALRWAETRRGWVEAQLAALPQPIPIVPEMRFSFAGEDIQLAWDARRPRTPVLADSELRIGGPLESLAPRVMRWLKREAKMILAAETLACAATIGARVSAVGVGDPVSRWGSCAANGAIRYSWRLILAPEFVRKATVAHEVAHLVHMNHGGEFHLLAARLFGADPAPARQWLRRHGTALHWFGGDR